MNNERLEELAAMAEKVEDIANTVYAKAIDIFELSTEEVDLPIFLFISTRDGKHLCTSNTKNGYLNVPGGTDSDSGKEELLVNIYGFLAKHEAVTAGLAMTSWVVTPDQDIEGMAPSQNPTRTEVLQFIGVSESGDCLLRSWPIIRKEDEVFIDEPLFSGIEADQIGGRFAAALIGGVDRTVTPKQLGKIANGSKAWPSSKPAKSKKQNRNKSCECGSGKKAKKCCAK